MRAIVASPSPRRSSPRRAPLATAAQLAPSQRASHDSTVDDEWEAEFETRACAGEWCRAAGASPRVDKGDVMNRKRSVSFASLLAAAAFALIPAATHARQWYSENVVIPSSPVTPVPVTTKGALTFHVRAPSGALIGTVKCKLADKEIAVNKARQSGATNSDNSCSRAARENMLVARPTTLPSLQKV